jgi:hypothetical protein
MPQAEAGAVAAKVTASASAITVAHLGTKLIKLFIDALPGMSRTGRIERGAVPRTTSAGSARANSGPKAVEKGRLGFFWTST